MLFCPFYWKPVCPIWNVGPWSSLFFITEYMTVGINFIIKCQHSNYMRSEQKITTSEHWSTRDTSLSYLWWKSICVGQKLMRISCDSGLEYEVGMQVMWTHHLIIMAHMIWYNGICQTCLHEWTHIPSLTYLHATQSSHRFPSSFY